MYDCFYVCCDCNFEILLFLKKSKQKFLRQNLNNEWLVWHILPLSWDKQREKKASVDFLEDYFKLHNFTGYMCVEISYCFCTIWRIPYFSEEVCRWTINSVLICTSRLSLTEVECFSFPLGFCEGSCCSACHIERNVRGRRAT